VKAEPEIQVTPLAHERVRVDKRVVETGRVTVRTNVQEHETWVQEELAREDVQVEWVNVDREIDEIPPVRTEGDTLIIPLFEEVLVVEKRLVLRQEIHVRRHMELRTFEEPVTVRRLTAEVTREGGPGTPPPDPKDSR
jgi:uncharacterized protein (TIGR02271 family)